MAQILNGEFLRNETNENSMGGTERLTQRLAELADPALLKECQIVSSRVRGDLDEEKIRIFWAHDLPGDPESEFLKDQNSRDQFHVYVFVSNWQMQSYIGTYGLPWSRCVVMQNAIDPIGFSEKPDPNERLNLVYHSTPHRGLGILASVFDNLSQKYPNLHLDVYSSFKLYGWEQRDEQFKELFDFLDSHEKIDNHGTVENSVIREKLRESHIFAYPSVWAETSCMCLMEAMSAGLACVHSNYGALYETAANWTNMYQLHEDPQGHAATFHGALEAVITNYTEKAIQTRLQPMSAYADGFYSWSTRVQYWNNFLATLINTIEDRSFPKESFNYKAA